MAAAALPFELIQMIFSFLDPASFHTARVVCKSWSLAWFETHTISQHLRSLPIAQHEQASANENAMLLSEAVHTLMLGVQVRRRGDELVPTDNTSQRHAKTNQMTVSNSSPPHTRYTGVQLLRPILDGYLLAGLDHADQRNGHYFLGFARRAAMDDSHIDPHGVLKLARLESFLSSWKYHQTGRCRMCLSEDMPTAHEHSPQFCLSPDSRLVVVAEGGKQAQRYRPLQTTKLFVYRLPGVEHIQQKLEDYETERSADWSATESGSQATQKFPGADRCDSFHESRVPKIPICLGTIRGEVVGLDVAKVAGDAYTIVASTARTQFSWNVTHF